MEWENLFSARRLGRTVSQSGNQQTEARSDFQRDFDRVTFSSAFRRLQSKTQVVPLPGNDFVHTRLTHSLEASCIGRSLGRIVGNRIIECDPEPFREIGVTASDFESVVAAACLAHDIGNPPFGHSGEDAISEYFRSAQARDFLTGLTETQVADLQNFEGNAAGFRLVTRTSPVQATRNTGLGLTFATLGAFTKYPKESLPLRPRSKRASERKFGFFQSEKDTFHEVADALGLIDLGSPTASIWCRHPLAFLVEAADDISYSIIDLEDGYKLNRLSFPETEELLLAVLGPDFSKDESTYQHILDQQEKIGYLRARAINELVWQTADAMMTHLDKMMTGEYDSHLTNELPATNALEEITKISVAKLYTAKAIVEIEAAGFEVLAGLLDAFLNATLNDISKHYRLLRNLIPDRYLAPDRQLFDDRYTNILNIAEMVSGMTDTFAIDMYKKIRGISLPSG